MVVADTDVVSYLFKRHPLAQAYVDLLAGHSVMISFMTIGEIEYGMESDGWGQNRREGMIAATAVRLNVPLATHNAADNSAIDGLMVLTRSA